MRDRKYLMPVTWLAVTTAGLALILATTGCNKKADPAKAEPTDTAVVLPDPPELDSLDALDEEFADDDFAVESTPRESSANKPKTSAPVAPAAPKKGIVSGGAYTLQVGIFNSKAVAQKRANALVAQGLPAYVAHVRDPKPEMPGDYYRVRVGSFATSAAAREYGATNLAPAGIDYWADLKGRDTQPVHPAPEPRRTAPTPPPPAPAPTPVPEPALMPEPPPAPSGEEPAPKLPDW